MDEKVFKSISYRNWPCIDWIFLKKMRVKTLKSVQKQNCRHPLPISSKAHYQALPYIFMQWHTIPSLYHAWEWSYINPWLAKSTQLNPSPSLIQIPSTQAHFLWPKPKPNAMIHSFFSFLQPTSSPSTFLLQLTHPICMHFQPHLHLPSIPHLLPMFHVTNPSHPPFFFHASTAAPYLLFSFLTPTTLYLLKRVAHHASSLVAHCSPASLSQPTHPYNLVSRPVVN